jgi:hypothetical protein
MPFITRHPLTLTLSLWERVSGRGPVILSQSAGALDFLRLPPVCQHCQISVT